MALRCFSSAFVVNSNNGYSHLCFFTFKAWHFLIIIGVHLKNLLLIDAVYLCHVTGNCGPLISIRAMWEEYQFLTFHAWVALLVWNLNNLFTRSIEFFSFVYSYTGFGLFLYGTEGKQGRSRRKERCNQQITWHSILLYILCFLPIKDVLRISVLSTRWKYLCASVTDIVFDENVHNLGRALRIASSIQWKDCRSFMYTEVLSCVKYEYQWTSFSLVGICCSKAQGSRAWSFPPF